MFCFTNKPKIYAFHLFLFFLSQLHIIIFGEKYISCLSKRELNEYNIKATFYSLYEPILKHLKTNYINKSTIN